MRNFTASMFARFKAGLQNISEKLFIKRRRSLPRTLGGPNANQPPQNIVLISLCPIAGVINCYSQLMPILARQLDSELLFFHFSSASPEKQLKQLYKSFGAQSGLLADRSSNIYTRAKQRANVIYDSLTSKGDLHALEEHGVILGDLIYDTYLRETYSATLNLTDRRLQDFIRDALLYLYTSEEFLSHHKVKAVVVDHLVYIHQGVIARLAMSKNIPIYTSYFDPLPSLQRVDKKAKESGLRIPMRYNYWVYPQAFARLTPEQASAARAKGEAFLKQRTDGAIQNNILTGISAFGIIGQSPILQTGSNKPKILILLHDFCDAVHVYRNLLFDDFYEWARFLLAEASNTDMEWYVKSHPNLGDPTRSRIHALNKEVIHTLERDFPRCVFLDSHVSNRQLIAEGIKAVFTMYGTAGHEFPYLGVPVVCAADNPHVAYNFCTTASSVTEYRSLIHSAATLPAPDKERINEFVYMHFIYPTEHLSAQVPSFSRTLNYQEDTLKASACSINNSKSSHHKFILESYIKDILCGDLPSCVE